MKDVRRPNGKMRRSKRKVCAFCVDKAEASIIKILLS